MRVFFIAVFLVACANNSVYGYLGGFEHDDGYITVFINSAFFTGTNPETGGPTPDFDVSKYNAGQFGANVNPGANYVPNPTGVGGLWEKTMGPLIASNTLPGFPSPPSPYATGHLYAPFPARPPVIPIQGGRALIITTNSQGWNSPPQQYEYTMDPFDLNGINPSTTGDQKIRLSFYSCASIPGTNDTGDYQGGLAGPPDVIGHTTSFKDAFGNLGVEVGYIQPAPGNGQDFAAFRVGGVNNGNWVNTGIPTNPAGWHRWDIEFDMDSSLVSIGYTPVTSMNPTPPQNPVLGTRVELVSSKAMLAPMNALEKIDFTSTPGINNSKVWALDDFQFCVTEAPLSDLLNGGTLWSGDKQFSDFSYHGGGDMPDAGDIFVKAITDADGNFGIRFQGAFVDAFGGGASDALIDYKVTAPEGRLIKDVHMAANPLVIGGSDKGGLVSVTETFLPDNEETVLSVFDIKPGSRQLTDWADLVNENGDLAPVQELHVQKDILVWTQTLGSAATLSFIDQTFSQCDADPMNPGACLIDFPLPLVAPPDLPGDFNLDGTVDTADYLVWRKGVGTIYTAIDLEDWRANFGQTVDGGAASNAVPEPASLLLIALAAASVIAGRDRRGFRSQLEEN